MEKTLRKKKIGWHEHSEMGKLFLLTYVNPYQLRIASFTPVWFKLILHPVLQLKDCSHDSVFAPDQKINPYNVSHLSEKSEIKIRLAFLVQLKPRITLYARPEGLLQKESLFTKASHSKMSIEVPANSKTGFLGFSGLLEIP